MDSVQISIADKWLQEWQNSNDCWSICIDICKNGHGIHYQLFALNTIIG